MTATNSPTTGTEPTPEVWLGVDVGPDDHLTYLLARVAHLLERRVERALTTYGAGRTSTGLTLRQLSALVHIARAPGLSTADLARALLTSPQAVGTLVQRLETAALIQRLPDRPGLRVALRATPAGITALTRAAPIATTAERVALANLDAADLATTEQTLRQLLDQLGDTATDQRTE